MTVLLVDFAETVVGSLAAVRDKSTLVPDPDEVVARAGSWAHGQVETLAERIQF